MLHCHYFSFVPSGTGRVVAVHWNGSTWAGSRIAGAFTIGPYPMPKIKLPKNGYLYPFDITAASANNIWASVTVEPAAANSFLLHWNGRAWKSIPLPATPEQLLQLTPDGQGGVWAIMFQTTGGAYEFARYVSGKWTFAAVPTSGLPGSSATRPEPASCEVAVLPPDGGGTRMHRDVERGDR